MPRANDAALEQRKGRLDGIRMNVAMRVLSRVINRAMLVVPEFVERPRIDSQLIGHNHFHVTADVRVDDLVNSAHKTNM